MIQVSAAGAGWLAIATALAGFVAAVLGILRYFSYRTKRDRIAAVGAALDAVVQSLSTDSEIQRAAAAIRLRRFFDRRSELGVASAAYARDALDVIAAVLRDLPAGNLQKLLADGLAYAPSLVDADLQRTNLQNAYLEKVSMSGADLFQADLTGTSIRAADAVGAQFYRTRLTRTVFEKADLRRAQFFEADLRDARFSGAQLTGAKFTQCVNVPIALAEQLDKDGAFTGTEPFQDRTPARQARPRFFISRPFVLSGDQLWILRLMTDTIMASGGNVVMATPTSSSPAGVLFDVRQSMATCAGVIVLGFRQLEVSAGRSRAGTQEDSHVSEVMLATPWNHAEAGLAVGMGLPVLRVRERGVCGGVFDTHADNSPPVDMVGPDGLEHTLRTIETWVRTVSAR